MLFIAPRERMPDEALALSRQLFADCADGRPRLAASVTRGPFIALGAHQRADRVLDPARCADAGIPVLRRATAGTAFHSAAGSTALVFALALPRVDAVAPDATMRTLINRNVRGFLQGLTRCGTPAHYFGREWITLHHRPAALLGYEHTPEGRLLLEVLAGFDAPAGLPDGVRTDAEREIDRGHGRAPISLREAFGTARDAVATAARIADGAAARWTLALEPLADPAVDSDALRPARVTDGRDPVPDGFDARPSRRCPIGWIDVAMRGDLAWLGGDVLAPRYALDRIARGEEPGEFALDGATLDDLRVAIER